MESPGASSANAASSSSAFPSNMAKARRSQRASGISNLIDPQVLEQLQQEEEKVDQYRAIVDEAKNCLGHGGMKDVFPEEWDAQLLIDAGRTSKGYRLLIFTPAFLKALLHDERELDRAFKYILLCMDSVVDERYVFVYCHSGMDWTNPDLAHRLRVAYDIVPPSYSKHLKRLYVVHQTALFRLSLFTFCQPFLSTELWEKITYVSSLSEVAEALHPEDVEQRQALSRRFPQMVQREDCLLRGVPPPLTFGVPLRRLCDSFGVDFTDKTTGRWYPRLPPALVFLCEALERQAADEAFCLMYTADSASTYDLVAALDEGEPLDPECPVPALWCALKLFVDCLPTPLLGEETFATLPADVQKCDEGAQIDFLRKVLHFDLTPDAAYMALYLVSFLHTMCENAKQRPKSKTNLTVKLGARLSPNGEAHQPLTEESAAEAFTPGFLRPKSMAKVRQRQIIPATSLVKTFIVHAEALDLWIGGDVKQAVAPRTGSPEPSSGSEYG